MPLDVRRRLHRSFPRAALVALTSVALAGAAAWAIVALSGPAPEPAVTITPIEPSHSIAAPQPAAQYLPAAATAGGASAPRNAGLSELPLPPGASAPFGQSGASGAPPPVMAGQMRVRIPAIDVDATVTQLGVGGDGVMQAPPGPDLIGWYDFPAAPGNAGNVLLSGHVDYLTQTAVFYDLRSLSAGDEIIIETAGGVFRYEVALTYVVEPDGADIAAIVGKRSGEQSVTLITCGGTFDRSLRQYDRRVIVRAVRVAA